MSHSTTMRGQISLELLVTLGIVLAFTVPIILLLLSVSSIGAEKASMDQADASARTLAEGMNTVYAQGNGAKRVVIMNLPSTTEQLVVNASEIVVKIRTSAGEYDGVSPMFAETTQSTIIFENRTGLFTLSVKNENGKVTLSEK